MLLKQHNEGENGEKGRLAFIISTPKVGGLPEGLERNKATGVKGT
jgi:hypothetical protein